MKLVLMAIGKTVNKNAAALIDDYCAKIARYAPFELRILPDVKVTKSASKEQQKDAEGAKFLAQIQPGDYVILLDERGKQYSSRDFSALVSGLMANVRGNIFFVVGGPYGFSDAVYKRSDAMLSMSAMVFPHDLIRIFFAEQLYRAFTIMHNHPYHHD